MNELIKDLQEEMLADAKKVQAHFVELAEKDGYWCRNATHDEDIFDHWDVLMIKAILNEELRVDIKNEKLVTKLHDCTWIETQNVGGNIGWLYGKANAIVFEKSDRFIYVDINGIRKIIDEKVSDEDKRKLVYGADAKSPNALDYLYKRYYRLGMVNQPRYDIVILIPFSDMDNYIQKIFMK
jgi:hypothetical protein